MKNSTKYLVISTLIFISGVLTDQMIFRSSSSTKAAPAEAHTVRGGLLSKTYRVTAYCPCEKCCGEFADGITASGRPATGLIVAAPPDIPFNTRLDIPGYGRGLVADRGGVIKGDRLDVLFPTHQEALEWGVQYLKVKESTHE